LPLRIGRPPEHLAPIVVVAKHVAGNA
jgi:hypothetical protein